MGDRTLRATLRQSAPIALDVQLTSAPGEVLAIFGPSGSGKSTILRSIAGLYTPTEAVIECGGERWTDTKAALHVPTHRRRVGLVFQDYALFPHLTAIGNVAASLGHRPRAARRTRAQELLGLVHLDSAAGHRRPAELSGGERQRVAVARALARDPLVLLLDEPFSAVDRSVRRKLQDEVGEVRRALDIPLVLVTHDFEDVVRLATHLLVLHRGTAVAMGPLQEMTSRPDLPGLRDAVGMGSVIDATVARIDAGRGLVELAFAGGTLVAPSRTLHGGERVRVRVPAREVILASTPPAGLSLHNILEGVVTAIHVDEPSDHAIVQLGIGPTRLLAEVTRDAVSNLQIVVGRTTHALIKSVSLEVERSDSR